MLQNCFYNFRDEAFKQVKSNDARHIYYTVRIALVSKVQQWQRLYEINS